VGENQWGQRADISEEKRSTLALPNRPHAVHHPWIKPPLPQWGLVTGEGICKLVLFSG